MTLLNGTFPTGIGVLIHKKKTLVLPPHFLLFCMCFRHHVSQGFWKGKEEMPDGGTTANWMDGFGVSMQQRPGVDVLVLDLPRDLQPIAGWGMFIIPQLHASRR